MVDAMTGILGLVLLGLGALATHIHDLGLLILTFVLAIVVFLAMCLPKAQIVNKEAPYLHQTEDMTSADAYTNGKAPFSTTDNAFVTKPRMPKEGMVCVVYSCPTFLISHASIFAGECGVHPRHHFAPLTQTSRR